MSWLNLFCKRIKIKDSANSAYKDLQTLEFKNKLPES